jgi:hypothetical protein
MPICSLGESLSFIFSARVELLRHWVCGNLRHSAKNSHRLASSAGRDEVYAALFTMSPGIPGASHSGAKHSWHQTSARLQHLRHQRIRTPASVLLDVVWLAGSDISQQAADLPSQS